MAYNGYMYGNVYEIYQKTTNQSETFKFGTGFTYTNGIYRLTGAEDGIANTRHYTCFNATGVCDGTASGKIYYVMTSEVNAPSRSYYYMELLNGKNVNDAIDEMRENLYDSNAKTVVEAWYAANMTNYTSKIEDTIYCNDREISDYGGLSPNGPLEYAYSDLIYATSTRYYNTSSPNLNCTNKRDAFTWRNSRGNQKLMYPIGLLTADEIKLAGLSSSSYNHFLKSSSNYLMSPSSFKYCWAAELTFYITVSYNATYGNYNGFRPSVSLKHGIYVTSGDGTVNNPYVIS